MKQEYSAYGGLKILGISFTSQTFLTDQFEKTKFNGVKELNYPLILGLFDKYITHPNFNGTLMLLIFETSFNRRPFRDLHIRKNNNFLLLSESHILQSEKMAD